MAYQQCKVCGKRLKNPLYRKIGIGPVCFKKVTKRNVKYKGLFDTRRVVKVDNNKNS